MSKNALDNSIAKMVNFLNGARPFEVGATIFPSDDGFDGAIHRALFETYADRLDRLIAKRETQHNRLNFPTIED